MKRLSQFCTALFAIILTTLSTAALANASAATGQKIEFPSYTCFGEGSPSFHCNNVTVIAYLFLPKDATNKAVLISHGTQGVDARHFDYADSLTSAGFAALVIDHWTTRGIGMVHHDYIAGFAKGGTALSMVIDTFMLTDWLHKNRPEFTKFGYMGESEGGTAAMFASKQWPYKLYNRTFGTNIQPPDALVGLYPACLSRFTTDRFEHKPFLFVLGEKDDETPAALCVNYAERMNRRGGDAKSVVLPGEYHDFDANYSKNYWPQAQNLAKCSYESNNKERVLDGTGEKFPETPQGLKEMYGKCATWGVTTGATKDKHVAVPIWLDFFKANLQDDPPLEVHMNDN
jgi:dienelactone hydrolase